MTWLWTLLIVVGIGMIALAVWPGLLSLGRKPPRETTADVEQNREGV